MAANLATHPPSQAAHQPGNHKVWTPARLVQSPQPRILHAEPDFSSVVHWLQ